MKEIKVNLPIDCEIGNVSAKIKDGCIVVMCEPKKWRVENGSEYYLIGTHGEVLEDIEDNCDVDDERYYAGNYFRTQEQAEKVANEIIEVFKKHKND